MPPFTLHWLQFIYILIDFHKYGFPSRQRTPFYGQTVLQTAESIWSSSLITVCGDAVPKCICWQTSSQQILNILRNHTWIKKAEGKDAPVHAMKAYGGSRGIAPLIFNLGTRWRLNKFRPQPFYSQKITTIFIVHEAEWASGLVWIGVEKTKTLASTRVRILNHAVCSALLYWLTYTSSYMCLIAIEKLHSL